MEVDQPLQKHWLVRQPSINGRAYTNLNTSLRSHSQLTSGSKSGHKQIMKLINQISREAMFDKEVKQSRYNGEESAKKLDEVSFDTGLSEPHMRIGTRSPSNPKQKAENREHLSKSFQLTASKKKQSDARKKSVDEVRVFGSDAKDQLID